MDGAKNYREDKTFRWLGGGRKDNHELFLTVCGIERCLPDKSYGPSVRDDYHVHAILSGRGTLEAGGKTYALRRGQLFAVVPGVEAYYYADPSDPWQYTWVSFSGTRAAEFMAKAGITAEHPVRDACMEPEAFLALTEKILDRHALTAANELERTALLYEAVSLLVSSWDRRLAEAGQPPRHDYPPDLYVATAQEYVRRAYRTATVASLAEYIGITRSYLAHLFQKKLRMSPQAYIVHCRLEQGRKLLEGTDWSVRQVADAAGYADPLAFSKMFKAAYGESPSQYRARLMALQNH